MTQELTGIGSVAERRKEVLSLLAERKQVSVREVSEALGVSDVTVRMDFASLERDGLLQRIWGGATLPDQGRLEATFAARLALQQT